MLINISRFSQSLLVAVGLFLLTSDLYAHTFTVDGNTSDWSIRVPNFQNLGIVARNTVQLGAGELVWSDAAGDTRTDLALSPGVDITAFQVTGSSSGVGFLLRQGGVFSGTPIQVQIAIDVDRISGSGQNFLAGLADTQVANGARWEFLVQTLFGSGGGAQLLDSSFTKVVDVAAAVGAADIELFVPWSALSLASPPQAPLRFTVATFGAQPNDVTIDIGGTTVSNAIDV